VPHLILQNEGRGNSEGQHMSGGCRGKGGRGQVSYAYRSAVKRVSKLQCSPCHTYHTSSFVTGPHALRSALLYAMWWPHLAR
jgi:hypothetical protein